MFVWSVALCKISLFSIAYLYDVHEGWGLGNPLITMRYLWGFGISFLFLWNFALVFIVDLVLH